MFGAVESLKRIDDETCVEKVERLDWMQIMMQRCDLRLPVHASRFSLLTSNRLKVLVFLGQPLWRCRSVTDSEKKGLFNTPLKVVTIISERRQNHDTHWLCKGVCLLYPDYGERHLGQNLRFLSGFVPNLKPKFAFSIRTLWWPLRGLFGGPSITRYPDPHIIVLVYDAVIILINRI